MKKDETLTPTAQSVQSLFEALIVDMIRISPCFFSFPSDKTYFFNRLKTEGVRFALIVIPLMGKAIEKSLITGSNFLAPLGWRLKKGTRLPLFLYTAFSKVYTDEGTPRPALEMDKKVVFLLRQFFLLLSKVEGTAAVEVVKNAVSQFQARTSAEKTIRSSPALVRARELLRLFFHGSTPELHELHGFRKKPWGRHGPGVVADRSAPGEKWEFSHWPGVDRRIFDFSPTLQYQIAEGVKQPDARVIAVPKDFRGPRIICIEPKENQFAQQGLMDILYRLMMRHPLTRGSINFWDVEPSRRLCWRQDVATIDLKDASDHLSLRLARLLLPKWIFELVTRYRTRRVSYEGHSWAPNCLATMGNACCFPLQTLLFWAIARSCISLQNEMNGCPQMPLRVFGDDIIVPLKAAPMVIEELTGCGLVVNEHKTCITSLVKESCGAWVIAGENQELTKPKFTSITDLRSWLAFSQYVDSANMQDLKALASYMRESRYSFVPPASIKTRWNHNLQRREYRVPTLAKVGRRKELHGCVALYAWHVRNDLAPFLDGTQERVKQRWVAIDPYPDFIRQAT